jgi:phosphohistidine swiveling domain-containing protein
MREKMKSKKINWFWVHRRNASLHHFSFLMHGLAGKGWMPAVNFWFDNQIVIGVPGKGCYVFYDKDQLTTGQKYKDVQKSIDKNSDFPKDFRRRTDEIFGAIFFKCMKIDEDNLSLLSNEELYRLFKEFIDAMMIGPIITVQLWGIEACFDENYRIIKFLKKRLRELKKEGEFQTYKEMLAVNTGETVAYTEQKNFYQVASELFENNEIKELFKFKDVKNISEDLIKYEYENKLFEKHIKKYEWVNTEYVSGGWTREKWVDLFRQAIVAEQSPGDKLKELLDNFSDLNKKRQDVLNELKPPKDVMHAINSLSELIAQRDWTKGYFTKALLSYNNLLDEIAERAGATRNDLLYCSYPEIDEYFRSGKIVSAEEITDRQKNGFAIVIKDGKMEIVSGKKNIEALIQTENIGEPFEKYVNISEFKGLVASKGKIKGVARVLEDASAISEFQKGEILVTYMTTIEFIPAFRKASAVVTDEGGMSCHAAIISREFGLPCIVGTKVATRVVQTGDDIEVDAEKGIVRILEK